MAYQILIKPLENWIGTETKSPGNSQFKQNYANTKKILEFELEKLNALPTSVRLEMFIRPADLLRDGQLLRAHAKPYKPGVILSFSVVAPLISDTSTGKTTNQTKTLSYPCDTYNDWQDNIRAIALSLEKLRSVARYGVFKYQDMISRLALPSAEGKLSTRDEALQFLRQFTTASPAYLEANVDAIKTAYRNAALKLHPDQHGGKVTDDFLQLQEVKRILDI